VAISFIATSVPCTLCLPCHTTENDPEPICLPTTYSPTTLLRPAACAIAAVESETLDSENPITGNGSS